MHFYEKFLSRYFRKGGIKSRKAFSKRNQGINIFLPDVEEYGKSLILRLFLHELILLPALLSASHLH